MNRRRKKSLAKKRSNVLLALFVVNAISLFLMSKFISNISFDKPSALLITAGLLAILEKFVEPILRFFAFPITVLTLGLFIINYYKVRNLFLSIAPIRRNLQKKLH